MLGKVFWGYAVANLIIIWKVFMVYQTVSSLETPARRHAGFNFQYSFGYSGRSNKVQ